MPKRLAVRKKTPIVNHIPSTQEMKDQDAAEDRLVLLKGVSGTFRPSVLTALIGVSGAGKTTLMDVLSGRKTRGYIEGDIKILGYPMNMMTIVVTPNASVAQIVSSFFYGVWNLFSNYQLLLLWRMESFLRILHSTTWVNHMVEMVLLVLSCCMDLVWFCCITIWRSPE